MFFGGIYTIALKDYMLTTIVPAKTKPMLSMYKIMYE